jgi:hypothetical protein
MRTGSGLVKAYRWKLYMKRSGIGPERFTPITNGKFIS